MANFSFTKIENGEEARKKLAVGINSIANFIKTTIGSKGQTNIIRKENGRTTTTKDGVSCSRVVICEDEVEDMGCRIVREACEKTLAMSGDGTTSSAILTQAITIAGMEAINEGANAHDLVKGIDKAKDIVLAKLDSLTRKIDYNSNELLDVAIVASNNDRPTGEKVCEAVRAAGKYGLITVMDSKKQEMRVEMSNGFEMELGYSMPHFINNINKMTCEYEDALIIITDKFFTNPKDVSIFIDVLADLNKPIIFICKSLQLTAMSAVEKSLRRPFNPNKMIDGIEVCFVEIPYTGASFVDYMTDLCTFTGATFISGEAGVDFNKMGNGVAYDYIRSSYGTCKKIVSGKLKTVIYGGGGGEMRIATAAESLKSYLDKEDSDNMNIQKRINRLTCTSVFLYVGETTEMALDELKDRVDDAIHATRNAAEYGIVAGGGVSYLECLKSFDDYKMLVNEDELIGADIVLYSLENCFRNILLNAGYSIDFIEETIYELKKQDYGFGFNVLTGNIENFFETGIINSVRSDYCAFDNAVSASKVFLSSANVLYPVFK